MKWHLVSYADENFVEQQEFLHRIHKEGFVHHPYTRKNLVKTKFYQENKELLDQAKGAGWWLWKPYYILETLKSAETNDFIIYSDCGDMFSPGLVEYLEKTLNDDDISLLLLGNAKNGDMTKRDCFIKMNCDESDYHEANQLEAGFQVWRVCDESIKVVEEWLEFCRDKDIINNAPSTLGEELPGFTGHYNDQSILTNLAVRDGLTVGDQDYRYFIECDYDYWYERGAVGYGREIEKFLIDIRPGENEIVDSIVLTVHNQEGVIKDILAGIENNTTGKYELVIVLDGCTDNSEKDVLEYVNNSSLKSKTIIKYTDNIYENRANNVGFKECSGKYVTIVQDDQLINEKGWNDRMHKPFIVFGDVFAVTGRTAHNLTLNPNSVHLGMEEDLDNCWCDILDNVDVAQDRTISRDVFAVRGTANRGPLMIDLEDLKKLNYLDEAYAPQQLDDHDLMFRMRKELGKVCGCYWIDFTSDPSWGASRKETTGFSEANPANAASHHKNSKLFYDRYSSVLDQYRIIEDRELPE